MPQENQIKDAFSKIKQDIDTLKGNILWLANQIEELKRTQQTIISSLNSNSPAKNNNNLSSQNPTDKQTIQQTHQHISSTHPQHQIQIKANLTQESSTGNDGVPTDRQTDKQTDNVQNTQKSTQENPLISHENNANSLKNTQNMHFKDKIDKIAHVSDILDSLDSLKKELRANFKHLTQQEMAVFSLIYELESQGIIVDYPILAQKLMLSESSIRDYVLRIIKKHIPIIKTKENNKRILLKISPELKKIASLNTILSLRKI